MSESAGEGKAWYEKWFGREYLEVYRHRNEAEAVADIDGIEKLLGAPLNEPILDLACGSGRHSIELARRGYTVTGIDLSAHLLAVAREHAEKEQLKIDFVRGDMRTPPFRDKFRTVLNMFTSFGYFESDDENARIMEAIARVLKIEGRFVIDYINREQVLATLVPEDEKEVEGRRVHQKRIYNPVIKRLEKTITIASGNSETRSFVESVRLFTAEEMVAMAENAGLMVEGIFGAIDGRAAGQDAPRTVLVGRKPGN